MPGSRGLWRGVAGVRPTPAVPPRRAMCSHSTSQLVHDLTSCTDGDGVLQRHQATVAPFSFAARRSPCGCELCTGRPGWLPEDESEGGWRGRSV